MDTWAMKTKEGIFKGERSLLTNVGQDVQRHMKMS